MGIRDKAKEEIYKKHFFSLNKEEQWKEYTRAAEMVWWAIIGAEVFGILLLVIGGIAVINNIEDMKSRHYEVIDSLATDYCADQGGYVGAYFETDAYGVYTGYAILCKDKNHLIEIEE